MLLQWECVAGTMQMSGKRPKANGVVLDGLIVENGARCRLCFVSQNEVVASLPWLRFGTRRQAPWASQFEVIATVVAVTTDRVVSAWLGDFAFAATAGNIGDVGDRRR